MKTKFLFAGRCHYAIMFILRPPHLVLWNRWRNYRVCGDIYSRILQPPFEDDPTQNRRGSRSTDTCLI